MQPENDEDAGALQRLRRQLAELQEEIVQLRPGRTIPDYAHAAELRRVKIELTAA